MGAGLLGMVMGFSGCGIPCSDRVMYWDFDPFPGDRWLVSDTLTFVLYVEDTSRTFEWYAGIRLTPEYPYRNLWVMIRLEMPSGGVELHRRNLELFSSRGVPYGVQRAGLVDVEVPLGEMHFPEPGKYRIRVWHIHREDTLKGVREFGFLLKRIPEWAESHP